MNALGWALIHFVWQGTVLGALLAISRWIVGDDQPRVR